MIFQFLDFLAYVKIEREIEAERAKNMCTGTSMRDLKGTRRVRRRLIVKIAKTTQNQVLSFWSHPESPESNQATKLTPEDTRIIKERSPVI